MGGAADMVCSMGGAGVVAVANDAFLHCKQTYCVRCGAGLGSDRAGNCNLGGIARAFQYRSAAQEERSRWFGPGSKSRWERVQAPPKNAARKGNFRLRLPMTHPSHIKIPTTPSAIDIFSLHCHSFPEFKKVTLDAGDRIHSYKNQHGRETKRIRLNIIPSQTPVNNRVDQICKSRRSRCSSRFDLHGLIIAGAMRTVTMGTSRHRRRSSSKSVDRMCTSNARGRRPSGRECINRCCTAKIEA